MTIERQGFAMTTVGDGIYAFGGHDYFKFLSRYFKIKCVFSVKCVGIASMLLEDTITSSCSPGILKSNVSVLLNVSVHSSV